MSTDQHDLIEPLIAGADALAGRRPTFRHRRCVLGILIAAIAVAEVSKDVTFSSALHGWLPAWVFFCYGVIACLPFLLARIAPKAAGFDRQWLPSSRWHWTSFLGMVFLLMVAKGIAVILATKVSIHVPLRLFVNPLTPNEIIIVAIGGIVVAPVAEEVFFRGYLLEQLQKITRSSVALLIQALLFGLFHLYTRNVFTSYAWFTVFYTFVYGMIFGWWRIKFRSLLPLVLAHVFLNAVAAIGPLKDQYDVAVGRTHPIRHTIARETTYITEPLRSDGSVDYVTALNDGFRQGVTPENNAAVLFWKAVGPEEIMPEYREKYFTMLGMAPLPETGDYFVDLDHYLTNGEEDAESTDAIPKTGTHANALDQLDIAETRPWSPQEFPVLAEWLAVNEKPLALIVNASRRPHRYDPLCCGERTPLLAVLLPAIQHYRHVAWALRAQAMLRLDGGDVEGAWQDLRTCHRLAALAGQGQTLIDAMVAFSIQDTACAGDRALLQYAPLTATQIARMREDLDTLPPMPKMGDKIDVAERFTYLNTVSDLSRLGRAGLIELKWYVEVQPDEVPNSQKGLTATVAALRRHSVRTAIDWDYVLRMGNTWFDRISHAYRQPTRAEQRGALRKLNADFQKLKTTAADVASLDNAMLGDAREALSERLGQVMFIVFASTPATNIEFEWRERMTFELTKLAFAVAEYRADHNAYPEALSDVTPKYVSEVPKDIFNDAEPVYRKGGEGYLLYSVGSNGKDDGGKGFANGSRDEGSFEKDWDDVVIRMTATTKP